MSRPLTQLYKTRNKRAGVRSFVFGLRTTLLPLLLLFCSSVYAQDERAILNDIVFSRLAGDNVQINFVVDGVAYEPGSFSTDQPARIALDFFGMKSGVGNRKIDIATGQVDSVLAVEAGNRTRVVINLYDTARYVLLPANNGYAITIYNTSFDESAVIAPKPFAARPDPEVVSGTSISNIDFRRSGAGGGKLIVDTSEPGVTVDTRETDGEIVIDFLGMMLPKNLERRLDLVDFATPVQTVDAFQNGDNVRLVVIPQGKYQHLAFQAGDRYSLVVDPIVETAEDREREAQEQLGFSGDRLSINFQKIDVRSALAVIADFTGINFVTSDAVEGEITINLKDVPWDQALDVIMRTKGLGKRQTGNVIWVAPLKEIQEFEEEQLKASAVAAEFAPLVSEMITVSYAKAEDLAEVIKSVGVNQSPAGATGNETTPGVVGINGLGGFFAGDSANTTASNTLLTARGSITADLRTNTLLIQDVAEKIKEIRELVAKLDKPVRQVLIETRIVEATDTFSQELGARLGFQRITDNAQFPGVSDSDIGEFVSSGTTEGLVTIQNSQIDDEPGLIFDSSRGTPGGLAVDLGANGINGQNPASYAFDIFKAGTGYAHLITLELSALEADGRGKVVASPRLITANQQEASIRQGEERVFNVEGGANAAGSLETKEAVLRLLVTPQITPDDRIIMDPKTLLDP
ncbi:MAG: type IV pilus secretin PilQ, partial [Pseudomonadota bacterium]